MSKLLKQFVWVPVLILFCGLLASQVVADHHHDEDEEGWISLFNGEDLTGWKAAENPDTFSIQEGVLVVKGPRAHLFYVGEVEEAEFTDFEWKCEIMTKPNSNSGMYFHTKFQEEGWPKIGYEVQVNCSHGDRRKTGGLYAIADVMDEAPHKDNEWFTQHVIVRGKKITVKVNDEVATEYTEPDDLERPEEMEGRVLDSGTLAIQGHDPDSEVHFRKILVRPLDEE